MEKMGEGFKRKEFFYCDSKLKGYFYESGQSDKLVVVVHGFRSGADDFLPMIKALLSFDFNVFSFDATGTYDSKGKTLVGMCQRLVDLDKTLDFLAENESFSKYKKYLLGYSLGGCAVLSVLSIHREICACAALAPVNDASELMLETAKGKIGKIAKITKPFFSFFQKLVFGKYTSFNAVNGINSLSIPVLIVESEDDEVLSLGDISVFNKRDKITNPMAEFVSVKGFGGHSGLWHSENSVRYKQKVDGEYKIMGRRWNYGEKVKYFSKVNHNLYSQPNEKLVRKIVGIFR